MSHDAYPGENKPQVHLVLVEGADFSNTEEANAAVIAELERMGIYSDELLLCGYSQQPGQVPEARNQTYAMKMAEVKQRIEDAREYPTSDDQTPYDYAFNASFMDGGEPIVSVYDPSQLRYVASYLEGAIYEVESGGDVRDAELMKITLA